MTISGPVRRLALAALVLALLTPKTAFALSFWVKTGGGSFCTHTTLQAAIDEAQSNSTSDTIYLVGSGPFTGPFSILGGGGLKIVGGVASCGATSSAQYASLQTPSGKRPLTILLGENGRITLRRLVITTSFGTLKTGDGGGLWFVGPGPLSEVVLDDSRVINSGTLHDGGGIFVSGGTLQLTGGSVVTGNSASANGGGIATSGGTLRLTQGSVVSSNTAVNGGGISGVNSAVIEVDGSSVTANVAYFDGGGIYAPAANVDLGFFESPGLPVSVAGNIAGDDGGGLYLGSTSGASDLGAGAPTSITGNQARRGGGIFIADAWTFLYQMDISLNTASQAGGGIYAASGSLLMTYPGERLADGFPTFTKNKAGDGAALYAGGALTEVYLDAGTFADHDTRSTGAALVTASDEAVVALRGITVYGNLAPELFAAEGGASLALFHASIAANTVNRLVRWDGTGPGLRVANSAFAESEPFFAGLPAPQILPQLTCVVSHLSMLQGMPPGTDLSQVIITDPQFLAPERGDLHVGPKSPAVDLCPYAAGFGANGGYDRDRDFRGFDEPFRANPSGQTFDAGADEVVPLVWDDFESGVLSHWNLTEPPVPGSGNSLQITAAARLGSLLSQRGLQLNLVNPASQTPNDAFVLAVPNLVAGSDPARLDGLFLLDPQGLTMSSTAGLNRVRLLTFYDRNGGAPRLALALARTAADKWSLEVSYWPDLVNGPIVAGNAFLACAAQPCGNPADWRNNQIELQWRGGNPAHLNVWKTRFVNGVPDPASRIRMLSLDLPMPGALIDQIKLGKIGTQSAGTFGQIFFDEVSFTR
jgi:hypothetical protein